MGIPQFIFVRFDSRLLTTKRKMGVVPRKSDSEKPPKHKALLSLTPQVWPDDQPKVNMKSSMAETVEGVSGSPYSTDIYILRGGEPLELLLEWGRDLFSPIVPAEGKVPWDTVSACLLRMAQGQPQRVIKTALEELDDIKWPENVVKKKGNKTTGEEETVVEKDYDVGRQSSPVFHNGVYRRKFERIKSRAEFKEFRKDNNDYHRILLREVMYRLKELYCGTDCVGRDAFNYNRNEIAKFQVQLKKGIRYWHDRLAHLRQLLVLLPYKPGERRNESPQDYGPEELRQLLAGALHKAQAAQLLKLNWDVFEKDYEGTIEKLESIESELKAELLTEQRFKELEKTNRNNKRDRNGNPKTKKDGDRTDKHGKNRNRNGNKGEKNNFTKAQFDQIKALIATENCSRVSDEGSTASGEYEWMKGLDKAGQLHVALCYKHDRMLDSDDEVTSIDHEGLRDYKRRAKKAARKFGRK